MLSSYMQVKCGGGPCWHPHQLVATFLRQFCLVQPMRREKFTTFGIHSLNILQLPFDTLKPDTANLFIAVFNPLLRVSLLRR